MLARLFALILFACFSLSALAAVDINAANQGQLETLPGIGPSKAAAIIEYRSKVGGFKTVDQLDDVPGIGPATLANLRDQVSIGDAVAPPPAETTDSSVPPPTSGGGAGHININTASAGQLEGLPGIGPSKAAAIVTDRDTHGAYGSCDDLSRVRGIGAATVTSLRGSCTVE